MKKVLLTIAAAASIFIAMAVNDTLSASQQQQPPKKAQVQYPTVSVERVSGIEENAKITAYGEVYSRNQLELTSEVTGKVTFVSPLLLSGNRLKKGELLASVEDIVYQQALATALSSLAEAKLSLAQEQLNYQLALKDNSENKQSATQSSQLRLEVAQAQYHAAQKNVEKAKYDLSQTEIRAPFDALVIDKQIQFGGNVQAGSALATLYDTSVIEISLPLSEAQWQQLPAALADIEIAITAQDASQSWLAKAERTEKHLNAQNRQRSLIARISASSLDSSSLFIGSFVKAEITGKRQSDLWKLPASALIDGSKVWQVSDAGLLQPLPVKLAFSSNGFVYVKPYNNKATATVVKRPLASYLANMKVDAQFEPKEEAMSELVKLPGQDLEEGS